MEMTVINEEAYTYKSLETGGHTMLEGHMGNHQSCSGGRGSEGKCEQELLLWFLQKEQASR